MKNKMKTFTDVVDGLKFERVVDESGQSTLTVKGVAKRADFVNKNRRYYPESVLKAAVDGIQDDVARGALVGLIRHPDPWSGEGSKGHVQMTAIKWTDIKMDGKDVLVEGLIVDTAAGKDLKALVDAKVHIGLSTNMKGAGKHVKAKDVDTTYQPADEYVMVFDQLDFQTIDVVNSPADVNASLLRDSFEEDLKVMDLEQLKTDNPELYKELMDAARAEVAAAAAA
ncbi:MAG: hypothetical protein LC687_07045, partial [Actinobacteria bacterium]|nr:hypothetical protein [Actinomycetota bacterium]